MKIIKANNFNSRSDLESEVMKLFSLTPDPKDAEIHGTQQDLKKLFLSSETIFWGIKCKETGGVEKASAIFEKPERGERHESSINKGKEVNLK